MPQLMPAGVLVTVPEPEPSGSTVRVSFSTVNVAVTDFAALTVTLHSLPLVESQPVKATFEPAAGAAFSVTSVPKLNVASHSVPQLMPVGVLVTVPEPPPAFVTFSVNASSVKVAVTDLALLVVTRHSFEPLTESQPLQATALEPVPETPFSATVVPSANSAEHSVPQLMPVGVLVTVPLPLPALVTFSVNFGVSAKVAVTAFALVIVTTHSLPLLVSQPVKATDLVPAPRAALSVTLVP